MKKIIANINPLRGRAFTLIELLVVISIIALLAALAFPSLKDALITSRINQSLSNLRQIGIVAQQYASENNGVYPKSFDSTLVVTGNDGIWMGQLWPLAYPGKKSFPGYGSKLRGSIFYTPMLESGVTSRTFGWNAVVETVYDKRMYGLMQSASQVALVGDSKTTSTLFPTTINARNKGKANVLFADGHVAGVSSNDIPTTQSNIFWNGK